jgi:hypothetical protein
MTTNLENKVKSICKEYAKEYDSGMTGFMSDLQQGGCQSGMISELIYYSDTMKFYKKYQIEINDLLAEIIEETGSNPSGLFGDKWDKSDPLAVEEGNQNILAWFAFEETASRLFDNN